MSKIQVKKLKTSLEGEVLVGEMSDFKWPVWYHSPHVDALRRHRDLLLEVVRRQPSTHNPKINLTFGAPHFYRISPQKAHRDLPARSYQAVLQLHLQFGAPSTSSGGVSLLLQPRTCKSRIWGYAAVITGATHCREADPKRTQPLPINWLGQGPPSCRVRGDFQPSVNGGEPGTP